MDRDPRRAEHNGRVARHLARARRGGYLSIKLTNLGLSAVELLAPLGRETTGRPVGTTEGVGTGAAVTLPDADADETRCGPEIYGDNSKPA
jgi:hypothetical protein